LLDISNFTWDDYSAADTPYFSDNDGNNVIKLRTSLERTLNRHPEGSDEVEGSTLSTTGTAEAYLVWAGGTISTTLPPRGLAEIENMRVFAFSSTFDYFTDRELLAAKSVNTELFNKEISNISHENVMADGMIASAEAVEFFDVNQEIYNPKPLRSISGLWYKTKGGGKTNNQKIINYFNNLLSVYESKNGPALKKMMNNVSYILERYADDAELLVQLNMLRKVFPTKSLSTEVGRFYRRYSKRVFTINKAIENSPQIFQKIILNPKIFDERYPTDADWTQPTNYQPINLAQPEYYIYETVTGGPGRIQLLNNNTELILNKGYVFFDYEKAYKNIADINSLIDINKLINYGFAYIPYKDFRVTEAQISRNFVVEDISAGVAIIKTEFDSTTYPISKNTIIENRTSVDNFIMAAPQEATDTLYNDSLVDGLPEPIETGIFNATEQWRSASPVAYSESIHAYKQLYKNSYLVFRNFNPANGESVWNGAYRLMCFEYQDFMSAQYDFWSSKQYSVKVTIEDNTFEIYQYLQDVYESAINTFKEDYLDLASSDVPLSYDLQTGLFSEYFSDGIVAVYEANPEVSPWFYAPLVYNVFRDLISNTFGGDRNAIIEASTLIASNINPQTGNFYAASEFFDNMKNYFIDYMGSGTPLYEVYASLAGASPSEKVFEGEIQMPTTVLYRIES